MPSTKASGTKTKQKAKEHSGTPKVIFMWVILELIRQMDLGCILMSTEVDMKDNGLMMFKKDKVKRFGSMVLNTLENIQTV